MQQGWETPWGCRSRFPPWDPQSSRGFFLVQFSTEADKSTLFLVAQALDSSIAGVPLMPHQFLSTGGVLTLCRGEEQDRQSWKPCSLFHLPRLG